MPWTPPETATQTTHALTIRINGVVVGAINEWNPGQTRTITELYEFGPSTGIAIQAGEPFEKVPGNISGMQISIRRYDLYVGQLETAFGISESGSGMLSSQLAAFDVREVWSTPATTQSYFRLYRGCWFSDIGRTLSSTDDRTVNVSATLHYTRRRRIKT